MARVTLAPRPHRGWPTSPAILAGLAVLVVVLGLLVVTGTMARVMTMVTGQNAVSTEYQTATVNRGNLTVSVTGTGPIAANVNVPLSFKSSGKLTSLKVNVGEKVTRGQVLATLDTPDLQLALQQARASLAQAQANLAKLQAGPTDAEVGVAQTSVDNAKRSAADAQEALKLVQASTGRDVAAAQISVASAQASLDAARSNLAAAQDQEAKSLATDQSSIDFAQKNLESTKAAVTLNEKLLLQQIERAKDDLYAAQLARDATCARPGSSCNSANASVLSAETGLNIAQTQLSYGQTQGAQSIAQAQATLDQAKHQLTNDKAKLDATVVTAQNQVKQAELSLKAAQTSLAQAQAKADQSLQSSQAQVNAAANAVRSAQAAYNQTVAPPLPSDVEVAKSQVANAQAAVDQAQLNLDDATLVAPFDGTIAAINGSLEQWVTGGAPGITSTSGGSTASATAIMTLFDLNSLQVTVQVNEADIGKVTVGDPVTFRVSAFPNRVFRGKVLTIQPAGTITSNVVSYSVTCSIQSTDAATLYPGMTATATIVTAQRQNVLLVPNTALSFAQTALLQGLVKSPTAMASPTARATPTSSSSASLTEGTVIVIDGNKLTARRVTLGVSGATQTEVLSGLEAGETVVVGRGTATSGGPSSGGPQGPRGLFGF
jgi:HlyD family secretion protein